MPWRSRSIASTRSSRSVVSVVCWVSISRSSSSARRLTAPSRSRSRRSRSSSASIVGDVGQRRVRLDARRAPRPRRARLRASRGFRGRCRRAGAWRLRRAPRRARLPRARRRALRARRAPRGRRRRARSRLRPGGRRRRARAVSAACDLADQRAALLLERRRRVGERCALGPAPRRCALSSVAIWATARSLRSLQACAVGCDRGEARGRQARPRAPAPAPRRAPRRACARLPSISARMSASWPSRSADGGSSVERAARHRRCAALRLVAARRQPRLGLGQRRDAARCCAPSRARPWRAARARCRPRAAPSRQCSRASRFGRAGRGQLGLRGLDGLALVLDRRRARRRARRRCRPGGLRWRAAAPRRSAHARRRRSRPSATGRRRARPAAGRA